MKWRYRTSGNDDWQLLIRANADTAGDYAPLGFGDDLDDLYVTKQHEGRMALWVQNVKDGGDARMVFSHPEVDISSLVRLGKYNRAVGVSYITEGYQIHFFDKAVEQIIDRLHVTFPGQMITIIDESWDKKFYLFGVSSDTQSLTYYRFNIPEHRVEMIYDAYPLLKDRKLAKKIHLTYEARDEVEVPAYITLPPDKEPENLPAIILPHGGPSSRDVWDFDWLAQFLAAKGYVVLQPNYRGSSGYGEAWEGAGGFRNWRTAMNDITDGANTLIKEGIVDADRLCIVGWSYGGYAALMSSLEEPDLYQCAISIAGVSDTETLWRDARHFIGGRQTRNFIGSGDEIFERGSPIERVGEFNVPILLFHGEEDYTVPVKHSEELAEKLEDEGKDHDIVIYENVAHGIARNQSRIDMLSRIGRFLDRHIGEKVKTRPKTSQASISEPSGP